MYSVCICVTSVSFEFFLSAGAAYGGYGVVALAEGLESVGCAARVC